MQRREDRHGALAFAALGLDLALDGVACALGKQRARPPAPLTAPESGETVGRSAQKEVVVSRRPSWADRCRATSCLHALLHRGSAVTLALQFVGLLVALSVMTDMQAKSASAEVVTNEWQQFVTFPVNTCNGEFVPVFTGVAHVVQRRQPDGSVVISTNGHSWLLGRLGMSTSSTGRSDFSRRPGRPRTRAGNTS